jgi:hypothetical protein
MTEPHFMTITEASAAIRAKSLSPVELTQSFLSRIKVLDGQLDSYLMVLDETALAAAKQAEQEIAAGRCKGLDQQHRRPPWGPWPFWSQKDLRTGCAKRPTHADGLGQIGQSCFSAVSTSRRKSPLRSSSSPHAKATRSRSTICWSVAAGHILTDRGEPDHETH